eukprot:CAMPEP_0170581210 /NCGR_PEP_ID=MMETSP0224-20130122/6918_1 /TAXON_ID=285029 /ORGANISM="Togula jolla, Strain CCCM 725" /LENGTH=159 /DNA_ID=CAMNT_0010904331 /DNA_START=365 /DNA_END=842 /DNA_ORIENTATION=+
MAVRTTGNNIGVENAGHRLPCISEDVLAVSLTKGQVQGHCQERQRKLEERAMRIHHEDMQASVTYQPLAEDPALILCEEEFLDNERYSIEDAAPAEDHRKERMGSLRGAGPLEAWQDPNHHGNADAQQGSTLDNEYLLSRKHIERAAMNEGVMLESKEW